MPEHFNNWADGKLNRHQLIQMLFWVIFITSIYLDHGYTVHKGIGISKNQSWSEESFFIENISLEDSRQASAKFGQLAFVFGDRKNVNQLVFT